MALIALLVLVTALVYAQVYRHDFIELDDGIYVTENPRIQAGLTADNLVWTFSEAHGANWHPLTTLSHMLDCELFGLDPLAPHLLNVLLHLISTVLLYVVLRQSTGEHWPSAFVAALFALHPLHVESVAWISERKDMLSGLFWMLTMVCYVRYTRQRRTMWYVLTVLALTL